MVAKYESTRWVGRTGGTGAVYWSLGQIRYLEDIRQGLEAVPACFAQMLRGDNFCKMLVQVSPDPTL